MRKLLIIFFVCWTCSINAQEDPRIPFDHFSIHVSDIKTVSLVFPYEIIDFDIGNTEVSAKEVNGLNNVLRVKAFIPGFLQTSLTVFLKGGLIYTFELDYEQDPGTLTYAIEEGEFLQQVLLHDLRRDRDLENLRKHSHPKKGQSSYHDSKEDIYYKRSTGSASGSATMGNKSTGSVSSGGSGSYSNKSAVYVDTPQSRKEYKPKKERSSKKENRKSSRTYEDRNPGRSLSQGHLSNINTNTNDMKNFVYWAINIEKGFNGKVTDEMLNVESELANPIMQDDYTIMMLRLDNKTNIAYDIDFVKFHVVDKKGWRRKAVQGIELVPELQYNYVERIPGRTEHIFAYVFPKFTLQKKKKFIITIGEKNGGRNLEMKASHRFIGLNSIN